MQKLGREAVKIIIVSKKASVLVLLGLEMDFMYCVRLVRCVGLFIFHGRNKGESNIMLQLLIKFLTIFGSTINPVTSSKFIMVGNKFI